MTTTSWPRRVTYVTAVAFGLLTLATGLANVPLSSLAHQPAPGGHYSTALAWVFTSAAMVPGVVVGTLLAARRPGNPIGWLILAIFLQAAAPVGDYAIIDYRFHHGRLPLGGAAVAVLAARPL